MERSLLNLSNIAHNAVAEKCRCSTEVFRNLGCRSDNSQTRTELSVMYDTLFPRLIIVFSPRPCVAD